jgi:flagellar biosynthesis/type III secretory pathway protein FliH
MSNKIIKKLQEKVEKNVLEYNGNWHKKGKDGNCEEFTIVDLREIIEQTYKQGYEKGYKQGKEDIVEKLRKEASNLEDGIRESGGSKKEIEDVFDNFYFTLSKLNQ